MKEPAKSYEHLVVEEFLGVGEVPCDAEQAAQLLVAPPPRLQRRQAVGETLRAEVVLGEGQDDVQFGVAFAHQLAEENIAAAAGTAVADVGFEGVQLVLDGVADGGFQGGVGGEAEPGRRAGRGRGRRRRRRDRDGTGPAGRRRWAGGRGASGVGGASRRCRRRCGPRGRGAPPGRSVPWRRRRRPAASYASREGGQQPVIAVFARACRVRRVRRPGPWRRWRATASAFADEQGEGGGVDAGKGIAAQFERLFVEAEGFAEPGDPDGRVGGATRPCPCGCVRPG